MSSICQSADMVASPIPIKAGRLVAFGDSMTRGYGVPEGDGWVEIVARLAEGRLGQKVAVFNAGGNGNTSREGLARFDAEVRPFLPATVLIEFGGNDPVSDDARHVTPAEFQKNLKRIIHEVRATGGDCVILTFPVVISSLHVTASNPVFASRGGIDNVVVTYRDLARECAQEEGIPVLDLDKLSRRWVAELGRAAVIADDGVHWTPEANRLAASAVLEFLAKGRLPE